MIGGKLIMALLGLPFVSVFLLVFLVFVFFFGYAGFAQNLALAPVLAENKLDKDFKPVELSDVNKKLIGVYKETAYNTVPDRDVKDHYRQETAYRLTWGLLAALDTVIFQLDGQRRPAEHARALMTTEAGVPLFEYKDSKITVTTTIEQSTLGTDGKRRTTRTTKTEVINIKLLTLARTFAGEFRHLYKENTATETSRSGSGDSYTLTTVTTTKENLSGIDANPSDMKSLRKILLDNGLNDETDLGLVLELADTYDDQDADPDGTTKNFWKVAMDKAEWSLEWQAPGGTTVPGIPGSIGSGGLAGFSYWPTPGFKEVSSPFGMRLHPIKNIIRMHTGIDIAAPGGTGIVAVAPGRVIANRYSTSYGNLIVIDHGDGVSTSYNHMRTRSPLEAGTDVKAGQTVGEVGSTGMSTGNHLHFEVRVNGQCRDPFAYTYAE